MSFEDTSVITFSKFSDFKMLKLLLWKRVGNCRSDTDENVVTFHEMQLKALYFMLLPLKLRL